MSELITCFVLLALGVLLLCLKVESKRYKQEMAEIEREFQERMKRHEAE
jgi:hypothetical protein